MWLSVVATVPLMIRTQSDEAVMQALRREIRRTPVINPRDGTRRAGAPTPTRCNHHHSQGGDL